MAGRRQTRWSLRALAAALSAAALAAAWGAGTAAGAEAPPQPFHGISMNRVFNDPPLDGERWNRHLAAARAAGIRFARSDAFWGWAEANPPQNGQHHYEWSMTDLVAGSLFNHGFHWLPILDYSTYWATRDPGGDYHAPPTSTADYAAYAAAFARRYGREGDFWRENPSLTYRPVTTYEIWNEPNLWIFWRTGPNAAEYIDLYLAARAAIKAVDPQAQVVIGGLVPSTSYVEAMYAARPEARELVDAIAYHPYDTTVEGVYAHLRRLRRTLDALGERDLPIHVTEVGWQTSGLNSALVVPEATRAANLARVAEELARSDCNIASVIPYTWTTPEQNADDGEDWYGIYRPQGEHTPTSEAYSAVVRRHEEAPPDPSQRLNICYSRDTDADGVPDSRDPDDDNDGARDGDDAFPLDPRESADTDGDGIGNNADPDDDNDGVPDPGDAFPLDPRESADTDADGGGNNADPDDDGEGIPDPRDAFPLDRAEWADTDADGTGDNADRDDDNDRVPDTREARLGTSPADLDSDDDGLADGRERGTDPARADTDRDRLPDGLERGVTARIVDTPGAVLGTDRRRFRADRDPRSLTSAVRADSDRDGLADGAEDRNRNGRRNPTETDPGRGDTDGDGVPDRRDRHPARRGR